MTTQARTGHTPGPWRAECHRNGGATIYPAHDPHNERGAIAALTFGTQPQIKADARLIAEAPAMLALLRKIADQTCDHNAGEFCPRSDARAILARVDGAA